MTKADEAILYLLNRIQVDPDLQYHMLNTESHALLMEAEADRLGKPIEDVRAERMADRQPEYRRREAAVIKLRKELSVLEDIIGDLRAELRS